MGIGGTRAIQEVGLGKTLYGDVLTLMGNVGIDPAITIGAATATFRFFPCLVNL